MTERALSRGRLSVFLGGSATRLILIDSSQWIRGSFSVATLAISEI